MINNKEDFLDSEGYIKLERDDLVMRKLFIKSFYNKIVHPNYDFIVFKLDNDYEKIFTSSKDITIQFTAYLTKGGYNVIPNIKYTEYLM